MKLDSAFSIVSITGVWILGALGLGLLSVDLAKAYIWCSILIYAVIYISKDKPIPYSNKGTAKDIALRVLFGRALSFILFVILWVIAMQLILHLLPFKNTAVVLSVWAVWVVLLAFVVRYIEKKWQLKD